MRRAELLALPYCEVSVQCMATRGLPRPAPKDQGVTPTR